ncbi:MAG TPA: RNA polymerase sigma factor [Solirubrobacteraceae bacterium]|nr:RNA polymerase sigma factor [Solirubrobacteraceae bacterium]
MEVSALKAPAAPGLRSPSALLRLQSDERLIALIRRGQHAAFETLFSRYQSRLLAFCRHMLGSKEDAEDVLQEVFAAAFNAILADEREINVRPWLYRIARNRSLNHLRKASAIGVDSMDVHFADNGVSTADKVMRRESFRQLIGDVQELPETQRTALLLREIDALSYEQISDAMETTVPAVKSLLVRARISLAEAAEARKLTCDEARMELGEVAEGLVKSSPAVRRHVRDCERCRAFRKQLKDNNVALAAILPVGPLLMLKKLVLTKLGSTAGAGGAHAAGAGGAGAAAAGAGAAGGASATGSFVTAGVGALATKAAAGLAVAAIVTAGTVAADHGTTTLRRHHHTLAAAAALPVVHASEPVITRSSAQPVTVSSSVPPVNRAAALARRHPPKKPKAPSGAAPTTVSAVVPASTVAIPTTATTTAPKPAPPVTEVTTDSTQLPSAQAPTTTTVPPATVTPTETTATTPPTSTEETATTPPPATTTPTTPTSPPPSEEAASGATAPNVVASVPQPVTQTPQDTPSTDGAGE